MNIYQMSGLPRSGSTLLVNLFMQNPRFYSRHNSGLLDILFNNRTEWSIPLSHIVQPNNDGRLDVFKAIYDSYHKWSQKEVVVDHCRDWCGLIPFLEEVSGKQAKIICCYRDIPEILSSFEKLRLKTMRVKSPPFENNPNDPLFRKAQTISGRCELHMQCDKERYGTLGLAYARIQDCLQLGFRNRLLPVHFDNLVTYPKQVMKVIYDFLEEDYFEHDFDNVEQKSNENDELHEYVDLHKIRSKVEPVPHDARMRLGHELFEYYSKFNLRF